MSVFESLLNNRSIMGPIEAWTLGVSATTTFGLLIALTEYLARGTIIKGCEAIVLGALAITGLLFMQLLGDALHPRAESVQ